MLNDNIYKDIAARSGGNVYIGVVGPVRTGKSTLIKKCGARKKRAPHRRNYYLNMHSRYLTAIQYA